MRVVSEGEKLEPAHYDKIIAAVKALWRKPDDVQKWRKRSTGLTLQATLPHSVALGVSGASTRLPCKNAKFGSSFAGKVGT